MLTVSDVYYNQEKLTNKADDLTYERNQWVDRIPFIGVDDRFDINNSRDPFVKVISGKVDPFIWHK
jgi:hypothetical protein